MQWGRGGTAARGMGERGLVGWTARQKGGGGVRGWPGGLGVGEWGGVGGQGLVGDRGVLREREGVEGAGRVDWGGQGLVGWTARHSTSAS